ncbi:MFS transporter [Actinopolymorpha singaporensis]|uniref:Major Facilitator Superfamily protein n=1 Tax=Actinopolymorpha singaporensis TaxID=117157 RepID=A0A1H1P856_9ACTN|nr:MFS transporter [Actinopolymorpha singaporensis]SDS07377.1 Major Facilitator Superfamily protein [Actinopolymorpha singaporensis]
MTDVADWRSPVEVSLWRNRDYMYWWSGTLASTLGSSVSAVALPLLIMFDTGSVFAAAVVGTAERLGALLTQLAGGALADRCSRKAILVVGAILQAGLMAGIVWLITRSSVNVPGLVALAGALGMVGGVVTGAVMPVLRRLVPRSQLAARAAQEQGLNQVAQLAGGPLAGILFGLARWLPFVADVASYLVAAIANMLIRTPLGPDRSHVTAEKKPGIVSDIREGARIVARHPFLRYTTGWVAVTNLVGNSVMLLAIALLKEQHAGPQVIGLTNAAILSGGVSASLIASQLIRALSARRTFLLGNWTYVMALGCVALTEKPWQLAIAAGLFVFAAVPTASVWEAYTASLVPDALFGRVGATTMFAAQSLTWAGTLLAGALAESLGASVAVACFALFLLPYTLANHVTNNLDVLRTPIDQVPEIVPQ